MSRKNTPTVERKSARYLLKMERTQYLLKIHQDTILIPGGCCQLRQNLGAAMFKSSPLYVTIYAELLL